jgi:RimJ/RimL family protein N-acetyltransferase
MDPIETERLVIRNFRNCDCDSLQEMIAQYEASEWANYDQRWPTCKEEIEEITDWFARGDNFLAVSLKDTGCFIGFVSLNQEQKADRREFNIGYIFNFDYHGKGYATEACRAVIGLAFQQLQADQIITGTAAANQASCHLLEKLGFTRVAEGRGSFRTNSDGKPIEFLGYTYRMFREEWETLAKAA